jgi:Holliday junction resolvase RusA-like endonuclease
MRRFTVEGEPIAKARPRIGLYGSVYTPRESKAYEDLVAWISSSKKLKYKSGVALSVSATFFVSPRPRQQMPDLDNLTKSLLDGLQKGGAIQDDVDVHRLRVRRKIAGGSNGEPRVEVTIRPIPEGGE